MHNAVPCVRVRAAPSWYDGSENSGQIQMFWVPRKPAAAAPVEAPLVDAESLAQLFGNALHRPRHRCDSEVQSYVYVLL